MAFKSEHFIPYLKELRRLNARPLALFMDQLSVHKGKDVVPWYERLDIKPIYNIGYSPEFNPIEACFSQVKRCYNRERLNALANDRTFNQRVEIGVAFRTVTRDLVRACVRQSEGKLNELL
jgi:transposase